MISSTGKLTTLSVNLTPNAVAALHRAAERGGHSRTDAVNRAIRLYDAITSLASDPDNCATVPDHCATVENLVPGAGLQAIFVQRLKGSTPR